MKDFNTQNSSPVKYKMWTVGFFIIVIIALLYVSYWVYYIDPYFHYHAPMTDKYYYLLDSQRYQNNGVMRMFDYDSVIIGTSMTENFRTSEAEKLFGGTFIKTPFFGATYKEIDTNLQIAFDSKSDIKMVIRGLDSSMFFDDKEYLRDDMGEYPVYLYDNNPFNDVNYLLNKDVVFGRIYPYVKAKENAGFVPGITSFDNYSYWMQYHTFGVNTVFTADEKIDDISNVYQESLSEDEIKRIRDNIEENIVRIAVENPNTDFYLFMTPYSAKWWYIQAKEGNLKKRVEAERIVIESLIDIDNIKLFSFNDNLTITADFNNYKDLIHYGSWINSCILWYMKNDIGLLTRCNYQEYINREYDLYSTFDYESMKNQIDYDNDFDAQTIIFNTEGISFE